MDEMLELYKGYKDIDTDQKKEVLMNHGAKLEVAPGEEEKELFTSAVNGCTVVAVFSELDNGVRKGVLTHFDPTAIIANSHFIRDSVDKTNKDGKNIVKIFVPGDWEKQDDKFVFVPLRTMERNVNLLELNLKVELGSNVSVETIPYSELMELGVKRDMSFLIKPKGNDDEAPAVLHWWGEPINI